MRPTEIVKILTALCIIWCNFLCVLQADAQSSGHEDRRGGPISKLEMSFKNFGVVQVYRAEQTSRVFLLLSGDDGWDNVADAIARHFTTLDAMVIGIDSPRYLYQARSAPGDCIYAAEDFVALSRFVQGQLKFEQYVQPSMAGYGNGGTYVYAISGQAPPATFSSVVSISFCRRLRGTKPFCARAAAGADVKPISMPPGPASQVTSPWLVLDGGKGGQCPARQVRKFLQAVPNSDLLLLKHEVLDFGASDEWFPLLKTEWLKLASETQQKSPDVPVGLADLPLIEVPAVTPSSEPLLAVITSGDGGWVSLDKEVARVFAARGIPAVGINSLRYLWRPKSPQIASSDLQRILEHYLTVWHKSKILLVGYSFGADIMPFMIHDLPQGFKEKIIEVALIGPSPRTEFEFHLTDWLNFSGAPKGGYELLPAIQSLEPLKVLCIAGSRETESLCHDLRTPSAKSLFITGGHHLSGDYHDLADAILKDIWPIA